MAQALGAASELSGHLQAALEAAAPLIGREVRPPRAPEYDEPLEGDRTLARSPAAPATQENETAFLLVPASDAGKAYCDEAKKQLSHVEAVKVPGQADLMFCREHGRLTAEELERILGHC